ncbi:MAG: hypothetical protein ACYS80_20930 [Planctomycetota bacterium]
MENSDFTNPPCAANCPYVKDHENRIESCEKDDQTMFNLIGKKVSWSVFFWVLGGVFAILLSISWYQRQEIAARANEKVNINKSISEVQGELISIRAIMETFDKKSDVILNRLSDDE